MLVCFSTLTLKLNHCKHISKCFCFLCLLPPPAPSVGQCSAGRGWGSPLVRMFTQRRVCGTQAQDLRHPGLPESLQIEAQLPPPSTPSCASPNPPACSDSSQQSNAMYRLNLSSSSLSLSLPTCPPQQWKHRIYAFMHVMYTPMSVCTELHWIHTQRTVCMSRH